MATPAFRAPPCPERAIPPESFLDRAMAAARACGVTRLADVTGLDRIGFPVWQAVRPAGRALSVHQGKGATPLDAKIGALCEAIESHAAEEVEADGPFAAFEALPASARAPDLTDYLRSRTLGDQARGAVRWCCARDLVTDTEHFLPHDLMSLDFTRLEPSPFDRSSNGLAAGTCEEEALGSALLEAIERDAVGEWERSAPLTRMATTVATESIGIAWLDLWRERLAACGADLTIHAPSSVVGVPVLVCTISGPAEFGEGRRLSMGSGAHSDPETALFRALAEAIQSRLTLIAGARDDILPRDYLPNPGAPVPPLPSGFRCRSWHAIAPGPASLPELVSALAQRGYRQVVAKGLGAWLPGVAIARVFVPGLGGSYRTRRVPSWPS
jgi:ribosomal protein S12 methylthiotransferase accessory factor